MLQPGGPDPLAGRNGLGHLGPSLAPTYVTCSSSELRLGATQAGSHAINLIRLPMYLGTPVRSNHCGITSMGGGTIMDPKNESQFFVFLKEIFVIDFDQKFPLRFAGIVLRIAYCVLDVLHHIK